MIKVTWEEFKVDVNLPAEVLDQILECIYGESKALLGDNTIDLNYLAKRSGFRKTTLSAAWSTRPYLAAGYFITSGMEPLDGSSDTIF